MSVIICTEQQHCCTVSIVPTEVPRYKMMVLTNNHKNTESQKEIKIIVFVNQNFYKFLTNILVNIIFATQICFSFGIPQNEH